LVEINKQATKHDRLIDVLLQMHIADEETKYGMDEKELLELLEYYEAQKSELSNIVIRGVMGMASFTDDEEKVRAEFKRLYGFFDNRKRTNFLFQDSFSICSMGMSGDHKIAMEEGSTMVRIGSLLFGERS
jgi:uncharacterized pyridoxal phosphate-containing UPF0001 family protein